jgi:hypothetical protein
LYGYGDLSLPEEDQRPRSWIASTSMWKPPHVDSENLVDKRNVEDSKTIRAYHRVLKLARTIADLAVPQDDCG